MACKDSFSECSSPIRELSFDMNTSKSQSEEEHLQHVKKQRGGYKAVLSKKENEIRDCMKDRTKGLKVPELIEEMKIILSKLHAKHVQFRALLKDDDERAQTEGYFKAVEQKFIDFDSEVRLWIEDNKSQFNEQIQYADLKPEDSVSQVDSQSNIDDLLLKAKAKKAKLLAEAKVLKKLQAVKRQELSLQQYKEQLELDAKLAATEAEEKLYEQCDQESDSVKKDPTSDKFSGLSATKYRVKQSSNVKAEQMHTNNDYEYLPTPLNVDAAEWHQSTYQANTDNQRKVEDKADNSSMQYLFELIEQQQGVLAKLENKVENLNIRSAAQESKPIMTSHMYSLQDQTDSHINQWYQNLSEREVTSPSQSRQTTQVPITPKVQTQQDRFIQLQQRMLDVVQLPKAELTPFTGNPLQYWTFMNAFDNSVGMTTVSDNVKLNRLFQYCTGKAFDIIQCCALMLPEEGYIQARRLLKERFGNDYVISKAWVEKITNCPVIKPYDKEALQSYADNVKTCMLTLKAMGKINEVDNQPKMIKVLEKLPAYLQGRWRQKAVNMLQVEGRYPDICMLTEFIEVAAREINDPIFGCTSSSDKRKVNNIPQKGTGYKTSSMNFNVKTNPDIAVMNAGRSTDMGWLTCHMCSKNHSLSRCQRFKDMVPEKRIEFVKEKRVCFNCFSNKHRSSACPLPSRCDVTGCKLTHSRLLHIPYERRYKQLPKERRYNNRDTSPSSELDNPAAKVNSSTCNVTGTSLSRIALPIVPLKVRAVGSSKFVSTFGLLDSGSTNTFCCDELIDKLGIDGTDATVTLTTLGKANESIKTVLTSLEIADINERQIIHIPNVFSTPRFPSLTDNVPGEETDLTKWPHLKGITIPKIGCDGVMILIGQDSPALLTPLEIKRGKYNEPYATRTLLGWTLNGPLEVRNGKVAISHFVKADRDLQTQLERFWKLETSESYVDMNPQMSIEDKRTIDIWENSIKVIDGHYQLDIPFKNKDPCLPNNYSLAKVRLESLGRKLSKQPLLFEKYKREIHTLLDKGYAEPVDDKDILNAEGRTWYLPHHGVTSTKKPDKLRIVFDCAAKYTGVSLNEHVLQGPEMTSTLIGVLLRFRERPVAIMGDVEAMFHQVKVTPRDRDALRFLWWEDDDINKDPQVFRMTVHLFGGVWSPSCASFAMRRTADDNAKDFDLNVMQTVKENFYVDDCLKSVHTVKEAIEMVDKLTQLLQKGGFNITKWVSNNSEVIRSIPVEQRAKTFQEINVNPLPAETALGVYWKTESDDLGFKITTKARPNSRRGMMSIISSVYDPFGFISPFLLQAKKLLQQECKMGQDWDDPLTDDNQKKWRQWKEELPELEKFEVKRCIIPKDFGLIIDCQIHHFSDASLEGYGTVSYIRIINSDGRIHCAFLVGKSRLAPLKQLTIPRLELSAAVLAVKIDRMLCKELSIEINTSVFWTDSMVVLHYIKNTSKRFQIFVANRVAAIHDGSQPEQWKYVETKNNPADICSRGLHAKNNQVTRMIF